MLHVRELRRLQAVVLGKVQRFSRTNTGTFAAQWMVADYNQFCPQSRNQR